MQSRIIDSKLSAPDCGQMLSRKRLLDNIGDNGARLRLICADAGYGKTVLMGQIFHDGPAISVWYQLDRFDADLRVFAAHLVEGLASRIDGFGGWVNESLHAPMGSVDSGAIMNALVSELAAKTTESVGIYLDDYHLVSDSKPINDAIRFLIDNLPAGCYITICSRVRPDALSLSKLKVQNELVEISTADLRFTLDETRRLMGKIDLPLADAELSELQKKTDGWPIALVLTGNACNGSGLPKSFGSIAEATNDIHDYLSEEVWMHIDGEMRKFLLRSSLPETVDLAIYQHAFSDHSHVKQLIDGAIKKNMMIVSLGDGRYRLHPLFRSFLHEEILREFTQEEIEGTHRKIADAYSATDRQELAVDHLLAAGDDEKVLSILSDCGDYIINAGHVHKLKEWTESLENRYGDNAWIQYLSGRVCHEHGDFQQAIRNCIASYEHFTINNDHRGIFISATTLSNYYSHSEDNNKCIYYANEAEKFSKTPEEVAECKLSVAEAHIWNGNYREARNILEDDDSFVDCTSDIRLRREVVSLSIDYIQGNFSNIMCKIDGIGRDDEWEQIPYSRLRFQCKRATILYLTGRYQYAHQLVDEIKQEAEFLGNFFIKCTLMETEGVILFSLGKEREGIDIIDKAIVELKKTGFRDAYSPAHAGTCYRRLCDYESAIANHKESLKNALKTNNKYMLAIAYSNIGADYLHQNDIDHGISMLNVAEAYARKYGFAYALTQILFHRALHAFSNDRIQAATSYLQTALENASTYQHNHFIAQEVKRHTDLLIFAISKGIAIDYLIEIFRIINDESPEEIRELVDSSSSEIRYNGVKVLTALDVPNVAPLLKRLLRDEDPRVRDLAQISLERRKENIEKNAVNELTPRESEIFHLVGQGLSNAEISEKLFISELTVKTHITKIFRKLGLTRRTQIVIHQNKERGKMNGEKYDLY